jgi:hypothetical protein
MMPNAIKKKKWLKRSRNLENERREPLLKNSCIKSLKKAISQSENSP